MTDQNDHARRLRRLRDELSRQGLDGFVIPRSDEHQGEYVAASSERLAWISGFTGSAGLAIVLAEAAAVFVDGRYTLQAADEVDADLFHIRHLIDEPAVDWIAETLTSGDRLGYDPWLLTPDQVRRYETACKRAGADLIAAETNPVDAVWDDRPPSPAAAVMVLDDIYTGETSSDKRRRIAADLAAAEVAAAVLTAPDSIAWLLNIRGGDVPYTPFALSFAVVHADARVDWFVDDRKLNSDVRAALGNGVAVRPVSDLGAALDDLAETKARVRVDAASVPAWVAERLKDSGGRLDRGVDPCQLPKAMKNACQVDGMRNAHIRDGAAMVAFLAWLDQEAPSGRVTEMAACDHLEALRRRNDLFQGLSFPTISGSGPNGAIVHYRVTPTTDRTLGMGELFLVDSGAQYLDGTTDITRTVAIGTPTAAMRRHWTLVLKGHIGLASARFPQGTSGSQLDILARQALWSAGLDFDHGTGHGVGSFLSVHEGPHRISKAPNRIDLAPGMVVSNEPGYYQTGAYGIRIENLVAVTEMPRPVGGEIDMLGFETLTLAPFDQRLVDRTLLTATEIGWVDDYHAHVRETLAPLVDAPTAAWLTEATVPLG